MTKAIWSGLVLAESGDTVEVEGTTYFPPDSLNTEFFRESEKRTTCGWKGVASYYHVDVGGERIEDAAWTYPEAKDAAKNIEGYVAFWKGVEVEA